MLFITSAPLDPSSSDVIRLLTAPRISVALNICFCVRPLRFLAVPRITGTRTCRPFSEKGHTAPLLFDALTALRLAADLFRDARVHSPKTKNIFLKSLDSVTLDPYHLGSALFFYLRQNWTSSSFLLRHYKNATLTFMCAAFLSRRDSNYNRV